MEKKKKVKFKKTHHTFFNSVSISYKVTVINVSLLVKHVHIKKKKKKMNA